MNSVYINKIAKFLPNEPISNSEMEQVLGKIGGKPSRARRIILRSNGIKQRYYVIDKEQNIVYKRVDKDRSTRNYTLKMWDGQIWAVFASRGE